VAWSVLHKTNNYASTASTSVTTTALPASPAVGSLLVAIVCASGLTQTFSAPADTIGNTWTALGATYHEQVNSDQNIQLWATINTSSATDTFTCTNSVSQTYSAFLVEFSAPLSPIAQDGTTQTATGASGTTITTPSITPTVTGSLLINALTGGATSGTFGFSAPWTLGIADSNGVAWGYDTGLLAAVPAAGTDTANGTFASVIVGIKAPVGGAAAVPATFTPHRMPLGV
jgi:hypothetical protein